MARISLWMLSLSLLLPSACFGSNSSCLSHEAFNARSENLKKLYKGLLGIPAVPPPQTCAQAAGAMTDELRSRSLSPWTHRLDSDPYRIPPVIAIAYCLCTGCIVDGHEDHSYNSVTVNTSLLVHRKISCSDGRYRLKREIFTVPVGCTCVKPKSARPASDSTNYRK